jgi:hypothetical protein
VRSGPGVFVEATPGFEPGIKALQASALPLGDVAVRPRGLFRVEGRIRLSKSLSGPSPRRDLDGADDGIRTRDPNLGKVVLYQLSHVRTRKAQAVGYQRGRGRATAASRRSDRFASQFARGLARAGVDGTIPLAALRCGDSQHVPGA